MKAVRLVKVGAPLELQQIPTPEVGDYDVLVRVAAAGICHSDVHYRAGISSTRRPPVTLGHEVAGTVADVGPRVTGIQRGDRVCLHYLVTGGKCQYCKAGHEQFCVSGQMLGKHRDGGYAEYICVPADCVLPLPENISFAHGAVMMCSSATALHALRKGRLVAGQSVAVFGAGGLGISAVQLAGLLGALDVFAVDINRSKLEIAAQYGAVPIDASQSDPVDQIRRATAGKGVDVTLELIGLPLTMEQSVRSLAVLGRAVWVGIASRPVLVDSYHDVLGREAEIIGSDDHLLSELKLLIEYARRGQLDLSRVVTRSVALEADAINGVMDGLERFEGDVRTVITP